jgi:prevent-host-death family protein
MASSVGFSEARKHLGERLDRVERGEEIVTARDGRAVGKLVPVAAEPKLERRIGGQNLLGVSYIAPDFDEPMSEEELKEWGY